MEDRFCQEGVMEKRYRVTLLEDERQELQSMVSAGKAAARKLVRARILLLADQAEGGPAKTDPEIADALGCGRATIGRTRQQFVEEGMEAALNPKPTTRIYERRLDGKGGRPTWWPLPAEHRRRAEHAGPCVCWPTAWLVLATWNPCATKPCGRR